MEKNDHDLLIGICNDVKWIRTSLADHLKNHRTLTLTICGAGITGVSGLIIAIVVVLMRG